MIKRSSDLHHPDRLKMGFKWESGNISVELMQCLVEYELLQI